MELLRKLRTRNLTKVMEGLIEPWGEDIDKASRLSARFVAATSLALWACSILIVLIILPLNIKFGRDYYATDMPAHLYDDPIFYIGLLTSIGFCAAYYFSRRSRTTAAAIVLILVFLIAPVMAVSLTHNSLTVAHLMYQAVALSIAAMFLSKWKLVALILTALGLDSTLSLLKIPNIMLMDVLVMTPFFLVLTTFSVAASAYREKLERIRQEELRDTVMMERNRIAEELHDAAVQSITGARRLAETIRKRVKTSDDDKLKEYVEATITAIGSAELEMRSMLGELRPDYLIRETLPALLQSWISLASLWSKGQIRLTIEADEQDVAVSNEKKVAIYRVIQEATSNAIRHANAKTIEVLLQAEDRHLRITVRDDGVGFDARANKKIGGTGNMERRIREAGGIFTLSSGSRGTEILFVV